MPGQFAWEYSIHKHRQNELRITSQLVTVGLKNNEEPSAVEKFQVSSHFGSGNIVFNSKSKFAAMFDNHQIRRETSVPSLSHII